MRDREGRAVDDVAVLCASVCSYRRRVVGVVERRRSGDAGQRREAERAIYAQRRVGGDWRRMRESARDSIEFCYDLQAF